MTLGLQERILSFTVFLENNDAHFFDALCTDIMVVKPISTPAFLYMLFKKATSDLARCRGSSRGRSNLYVSRDGDHHHGSYNKLVS